MTKTRRASAIIAVSVAAGIACGFSGGAVAQGGYWGEDQRRGQQGGGYRDEGNGGQGGYGQQGYSPREMRCRELEQQLAGDWTRSQGGQEQLPRLDEDIRATDRVFQRAQYEADRADCYEDMFIFGRELKRTRQCIDLNRQIEDARRRLAELRQQRDSLTRSGSRRGRQDDIVAELARNRCGETYQRQHEARRRENSFFGFWEDGDSGGRGESTAAYGRPDDMPFGTYRTMCVRTCDGYYFPISYSTLQSKFREDEDKCRSQCSAPTELYVYRNPGEDVEQMVSLTGAPYAQAAYAFKHRKAYIKGCSCNAAEYSAEEIAKAEQALKNEAETRRTAAAKPKEAPPATDAAPPATAPEAAPVKPGAAPPPG